MAVLRSARIAAGRHIVAQELLDVVEPHVSNVVIYTVPPGKRAIIRDWRLTANAGTGSDPTLALYIVVAGSGIYITRGSAVVNQTLINQGGHIVLEPTDTLRLSTGWTTTDYVVSGAILDIPL